MWAFSRMKAVIYVSQAVNSFNIDELIELSNQAAKHNSTVGITGYLWHEKGQFLQYIEGEEEQMDALISKIASDERHNVLHQLETMEITETKFPNWHMKYFQPNQMAIEINHEKILSNQLLFLKSASINDPKLIGGIWRLVDSLAKFN